MRKEDARKTEGPIEDLAQQGQALVQQGQAIQQRLALEAIQGKRAPESELSAYLVRRVRTAQARLEKLSLALEQGRAQVSRLERDQVGQQAIMEALLADLGQALMVEKAEDPPGTKEKG